jgi:hypothetical protein
MTANRMMRAIPQRGLSFRFCAGQESRIVFGSMGSGADISSFGKTKAWIAERPRQ